MPFLSNALDDITKLFKNYLNEYTCTTNSDANAVKFVNQDTRNTDTCIIYILNYELKWCFIVCDCLSKNPTCLHSN